MGQSANRWLLKNYTTLNGLPQNTVRSMAFDSFGFLWLATDGGLVRWDGNEFKVFTKKSYAVLHSNRFLLVQNYGENIFAVNEVNEMILVNASGILLGTGPSLNSIKKSIDTKQTQVDDKGDYHLSERTLRYKNKLISQSFDSSHSRRFFYIHNDTLSVAPASNNGFALHFYKGEPINKKKLLKFHSAFLPHSPYIKISDQYYVQGNAIYGVHTKGNTVSLLKEAMLPSDANIISALYNPQLNTFFIGTINRGFYKVQPSNFNLFTNESLSKVYVYDYFEREGKYYPSNYIPFLNKASLPSAIDNPRISKEVFFVYNDSVGNYWYSYKGSLHCYSVKAGKVVKQYQYKGTEYYNLSMYAYAGQLYVSAKDIVYRVEKDSLLPVSVELSASNRNAYINSIAAYHFGKPGDILIGSTEGLHVMNLLEGKKSVLKQLSTSALHVRNIQFDARLNGYFICTTGDGYYFLNEANKLIGLPLDTHGFLSSTHYCVYDKLGYYWLGCNNGIFRTSAGYIEKAIKGGVSEIPYYYYNEDDGLMQAEINGNGISRNRLTADNRIIFPALGGIIDFSPTSFQNSKLLSGVSLSYIVVDGKDTLYASPYTIPANYKRIDLFFKYAYFGHAEDILVRYSIGKGSSFQTPLPTSGILSLQGLSYGNYPIHIIMKTPEGEKTFVWQIQIQRYWWQQWWALALGFLLLLCIVSLVTYYLLARQKSRLLLKNLVVESELKALRSQLNPHFVQNTFDLVALSLYDKDRDSAVELIKEVSIYFRKVLNLSEKMRWNIEEEVSFTEDYLRLQQQLYPSLFEYDITIADDTDTIGIEVPSMLLQPVVENCIKHGFAHQSKGGKINIEIYTSSAAILTIIVKDNGSGYHPVKGLQSQGLKLTKKRIKLSIKDKMEDEELITMRNRTDGINGTCVEIKIPYNTHNT
ncbi:MAG: hypothetical protein RIR12_1596 [Bacteroidota bacterium]|jgi:hypothetical protein